MAKARQMTMNLYLGLKEGLLQVLIRISPPGRQLAEKAAYRAFATYTGLWTGRAHLGWARAERGDVD